ncbi:hypothetical protein W03_11950 [Nitrosomonas sp. PY1]|uniref:multidrug ABC transporter permease n=1 Tax=Nitrosomonas sp. PY1 TaxID=1803906 RepID=UPI001FC84DA0|nr:multidrug ABC transporter permease [Nitrosomonas sp. PY1]GKS69191.1 hypothetical protein W03_11950 [Nitrosomonas sp. PY1]
MLSFIKILASFFSFLLVLFFISTILTITSNLPIWLNVTVSLALALLSGWFGWQLTSGQRTGKGIAIVSGALIIGGISFTLVFLGSMAIIKDTSQGPLVGIFIATPLGLILGAIGGYRYAASEI